MTHSQAPTYPYDIPSIHQSNPAVPPFLGPLDLNRSVQAGAPIDAGNLAHAKSVARVLRNIHELSGNEAVTEAVAQSAELRAAAVEAAHVSAAYMPVNIALALQNMAAQLNQLNQGFNHIEQCLDRVEPCMEEILAISHNTRILAHNRQVIVPSAFQPLYKTIPGNGLNLAKNIYGHLPQLQNILVAPDQEPLVGEVLSNFITDYELYDEAEIIRLIIFYNEDFGIVANDPVEICYNKFLSSLVTY